MHVPGLECAHAEQDHSSSPCNIGADRSHLCICRRSSFGGNIGRTYSVFSVFERGCLKLSRQGKSL